MFCDLVGSTALTQQIDPEPLRELMHAYQGACAAVIERYDGHVAQYLGDGLVVYFGWPRAHEDAAERSVRAALAIVDAVKHVAAPVPLKVRIGIATGSVVVGETGAGDASVPKFAVGETPNLAARLQGLAGADHVVVGPSTHRLLGAAFEYEDLGHQCLKGIAEPMRAWRVLRERRAEGRFEATHAVGLTPLVGREEEIGVLVRRWEQAKAGDGQVVLLGGEPGIGKSRITRVLRERIAGDPHTRLRYQCSPFHTQSALYPVIEQLEQASGFAEEDSAEQKLDKLEAVLAQAGANHSSIRSLFAALLSLPLDRYPPLAYEPQKLKEKTIEVLIGQVEGLSRLKPVLMIFEDAHWVDPTTQETFDLLVTRVQDLRVLLVWTYRPEYAPHWSGQSHVTTVLLNRLNRRQAARLVEEVTGGRPLPREVLDQIVAKTDGVPLFVEELTKAVLESGLVRAAATGYELRGPLTSLAIPSTLHDSLMARLDRLATVKEVAQIGACIGREVSHELLSVVADLPESRLQSALEQLVDSELIFRRGLPPAAVYTFKHALVQDAAYASLLNSRRQLLHRKIAQILEERFPGRVATEPEVVAHHYTAAGLPDRAVGYWLEAGRRAVQRSANVEAVEHLGLALDLVGSLPAGAERDQRELALQTALVPALIATRGYASPQTAAAVTRARELCECVGDPAQVFPMLFGVWVVDLVGGNFRAAREQAGQCLALAESRRDPALLVIAHAMTGDSYYWLGELTRARGHFETSLSLYDEQTHGAQAAQYGFDMKTLSLHYLGWLLWALGYPDQASRAMQESQKAAKNLGHAFSLAHAMAFDIYLRGFRREPEGVEELAENLIAFSEEHGFFHWAAAGRFWRGWVRAAELGAHEGLAQMRDSMAAIRGGGANIASSIYGAFLAESYARAGRIEEGLRAVDEALSHIERHGERPHEADLHRLKGELLLAQAPPDEASAETCFRTAIEIARRQQTKLLELRGTTSLARLWQRAGKRDNVREMLAEIHGWFTEGFDLKDLQEAKALLVALS